MLGKLELSLPDLGKGMGYLQRSAQGLEMKIKEAVPEEHRSSVVVRPFRKGDSTGLTVDYDDRIESLVFFAIEEPRA